jgi:hypothetical protein
VLSGAGRASADDFVVTLWLRPDAKDAGLAQRVRGQVSDLPIRLIETEEPGAEAPMSQQLDVADSIARQQGARVVVWFAPLDPRAPRPGLLVVVAEAARGRVLVRRVESEAARPAAGGPADFDSATLEAAALIVRTALRGLAEGAVIGLDRSEVTGPAAKPAPLPPLLRPATVMVVPRPLPPTAPARWIAAVGWHADYDGQAIQQGLTGHVGYAIGRWAAGLLVAPSLGVELADRWATLHLGRHAFGAFGQLLAVETTQAALGFSVSAGAILFQRSTSLPAPNVAPTASALNPVFFAGLRAHAGWFPPWLGGSIGVWIDAGAEVVPGAPTLGYDVGGQFVPSRSLWRVQPGGAAGVILRTP